MMHSLDNLDIVTIRAELLALQSSILDGLQALEPKPFARDAWTRAPDSPLQGDGASCLVEGGEVFERGGCNFSHVRGQKLPPTASSRHPQLAGSPFEAMGVSLVMHPRNPFVPTVHLNVRLLMVKPLDAAPTFWFGGGMDLTPYYAQESDVVHFHQACKTALDPYGEDKYPRFKTACDDYFYLKHRNEARGVGGIFFDDFSELGGKDSWDMTRAAGSAFLPAYVPIVQARMNTPYGEPERDFQAYRRGRYVEFNLVYDRGTLFGLHGGGRTESILMSMPPVVHWKYDWTPAPGSAEAALYSDFLPRKNWLNLTV
jgi:coproporphyrinogen III oxidase